MVDPSVVQLQKLRRKDLEYEKLLDAFMTTLKQPGYSKKVNVLEISRIQNLAMWQSYVVKRQTIGMSGVDERFRVESLLIRRLNGRYSSLLSLFQNVAYRETGLSGNDTSADDKARQRKAIERFERCWLFHGTNVEVMDKIMQQGFNRSFWYVLCCETTICYTQYNF